MELTNSTRSSMVEAFRVKIDGTSSLVGKFEFYTKDNAFIVALTLAVPCMTIVNGVGTFNDTMPYLRGTVGVGYGGLANRFVFKDNAGTTRATGTCGDPTHTGKDIQFNTLQWNDYDNISITGLTVTQPTGSNDYIP